MDYSQITDFEINCAVAGALNMPPWPEYGYAGTQPEPFTAAICHGGGRLGGFDPCNSWGDAGPIIQKHGLTVACYKKHKSEAWVSSLGIVGAIVVENDNPLRAAMIAFLMLQEGK